MLDIEGRQSKAEYLEKESNQKPRRTAGNRQNAHMIILHDNLHRRVSSHGLQWVTGRIPTQSPLSFLLGMPISSKVLGPLPWLTMPGLVAALGATLLGFFCGACC